jgi:hypothetical protein
MCGFEHQGVGFDGCATSGGVQQPRTPRASLRQHVDALFPVTTSSRWPLALGGPRLTVRLGDGVITVSMIPYSLASVGLMKKSRSISPRARARTYAR